MDVVGKFQLWLVRLKLRSEDPEQQTKLETDKYGTAFPNPPHHPQRKKH